MALTDPAPRPLSNRLKWVANDSSRRIRAFDDRFPHLPRWSPAFNVVDFLMERNWEYEREL